MGRLSKIGGLGGDFDGGLTAIVCFGRGHSPDIRSRRKTSFGLQMYLLPSGLCRSASQ